VWADHRFRPRRRRRTCSATSPTPTASPRPTPRAESPAIERPRPRRRSRRHRQDHRTPPRPSPNSEPRTTRLRRRPVGRCSRGALRRDRRRRRHPRQAPHRTPPRPATRPPLRPARRRDPHRRRSRHGLHAKLAELAILADKRLASRPRRRPDAVLRRRTRRHVRTPRRHLRRRRTRPSPPLRARLGTRRQPPTPPRRHRRRRALRPPRPTPRRHRRTDGARQRRPLVGDPARAGKRELLVTPTNEAVDELNHDCQLVRIRAGEIDPTAGRSTSAPVHDLRRRRDRHPPERPTPPHRPEDMVRNRAIWTVDTIHPDGSLTATGKHGSVHLPAKYVNEHVELAYAHTVMAAQGRNVYGGLLFADRPMDIRTCTSRSPEARASTKRSSPSPANRPRSTSWSSP
jgi:hypothetical protein